MRTSALAPFFRGDYEKQSSTAAGGLAAGSLGVFRRGLRPCRIQPQRFTNTHQYDGGVPAAVGFLTTHYGPFPAHRRVHVAERDRRPAGAHLHRKCGRPWTFKGTLVNSSGKAKTYTVAIAVTVGAAVQGHTLITETVQAGKSAEVSAENFAKTTGQAGTCEPVVSVEDAS